MFSDVVLVVRTGAPGSGKTYWAVKEIYDHLLEYYPQEMKIVTNLPLTHSDARIEVREFTDDQLSNPSWEEFEGCVLILDEAQRWLTKQNAQAWKIFIGEARHHGIRMQLLTPSKDNLPDWASDLIEIWYESQNGRAVRDPWVGLLFHDWAQIWAKLTGKYVAFFEITEYRKVGRNWKPQSSHKEWFDRRIGSLYNSKNKSLTDTVAAERKEDWQVMSWWRLFGSMRMRNQGVLIRVVGLSCKTIVPVVLGLVGLGAVRGFTAAPPVPVHREPERVVPVEKLRELERGEVRAAAEAKVPVAPVVVVPKVKAVVTWLLMLMACCGCVHPTFMTSGYVSPVGVGRAARALSGEPRVGIVGPGHSLDDVSRQAGFGVAPKGLLIDGPAVGRDVFDKARTVHGLELQGDKLVPGRREWTAVPDEFSEEDVTPGAEVRNVGGRRVAKVTQVERDQWRDVADVRHECYLMEVLLVSVNSSDAHSLSAGVGGSGGYSLSYPKVTNPFTALATVSIKADGSWVRGRQLGRPVLRCANGESANVHVGSKFPYKLASSSTSIGGASTTIGSTVQNVVTGTEVTLSPKRISLTQVELDGSVKISDTTGSNDNIPITVERSASISQILDLGAWQLAARLDAVAHQRSGQWLSLGGSGSVDEQCFVVLVRVVQDVIVEPQAKACEVPRSSLPEAIPIEVPKVDPPGDAGLEPVVVVSPGAPDATVPVVEKVDGPGVNLSKEKAAAAEALQPGVSQQAKLPAVVMDKATGRPAKQSRSNQLPSKKGP